MIQKEFLDAKEKALKSLEKACTEKKADKVFSPIPLDGLFINLEKAILSFEFTIHLRIQIASLISSLSKKLCFLKPYMVFFLY